MAYRIHYILKNTENQAIKSHGTYFSPKSGSTTGIANSFNHSNVTASLRNAFKLRTNGYYQVTKHPEKEDILVFFCHLGLSYVCLSHLLGISPSVLWQSFFSAPTSVTILGSEKPVVLIIKFRFRCPVGGEKIPRHIFFS